MSGISGHTSTNILKVWLNFKKLGHDILEKFTKNYDKLWNYDSSASNFLSDQKIRIYLTIFPKKSDQFSKNIWPCLKKCCLKFPKEIITITTGWITYSSKKLRCKG